MELKVLQIENLQAAELFGRLEKLESAINALSEKKEAAKSVEAGLITRAEVSAMLKVTLVTVNDWVNKGVLTAYKCGNRVYFKREEVEAALIRKGGKYAHR